LENLKMEQSSSLPPKIDGDKSGAPHGRNGNAGSSDAKDASGQRMVADQLMAALASGDLKHLAQARHAFLNEGQADSESRSQARTSEHGVVQEDLSAQEAAL
jgi:hypothetical protein